MTTPQIHTFSVIDDADYERVITLCGADILTVHTIQTRHTGKREHQTWRRYRSDYEAEAAFREQATYWLERAGRHLSVTVTGL